MAKSYLGSPWLQSIFVTSIVDPPPSPDPRPVTPQYTCA